jgi:hypothetical protein
MSKAIVCRRIRSCSWPVQIVFAGSQFHDDEIFAMKSRKEHSILWIEGIGFSVLIALSWLTETARIPHYFFGEPFAANWHRAVLRTVVILLIWTWVHVATKRLLKRLHHLEEFLRICGWCRKVCHNGAWINLEQYFNSKFATSMTHGMCPECLEKAKGEFAAESNPGGEA